MATSSALDPGARQGLRAADLPRRYRERVLAAFPGQVERIVLFGSRARGEQHRESDWELCGVPPPRADRDRQGARLSEVTGWPARPEGHE